MSSGLREMNGVSTETVTESSGNVADAVAGGACGQMRRLGSLIGREGEQAALADLVAAVIAGDPCDALVRGAPGTGKTALVTAAAHEARRAGAMVLHARAVAVEQSLPYAVLQVLLLQHVDGPAYARRPDVRPDYVSTIRLALGLDVGRVPSAAETGSAVLSLVTEIASDTPVLIVVDDLHHADEESAVVLESILSARLARVGVLAAASTDIRCATGPSTYIDVGPLDNDAAAVVLRRAHPLMAAQVRRRILLSAGGNPLALRALPAELRHDQLDGSASLPTVLPMSTALRTRLFPDTPVLPSATRRMLLMHVIDPALPVDELVTAFDGASLPELIAPAARAGLVEAHGLASTAGPGAAEFRFRRPLLGAALMSAATDDERSSAYRSLARCARRATTDGFETHLDELESCVITGFDDASAARLERDGEADLWTGNWSRGLFRLRRASELTSDPRERHRRLARATQIAARVDHAAAQRMFVDMQTGQRHFEDSMTDALAASAIIVTDDDGDVDTAYRMLREALERTAPHDPDDPLVVEAVEALRELCWLGGRTSLWEGYRQVVGASSSSLWSAIWNGPATLSTDRRKSLDMLIARLSVEDSPLRIAGIAEMAATFDRIDECRGVLEDLVSIVDSGIRSNLRTPVGASIAAVWAMLLLAQDAFHRGEWDRTTELAQQARYVCDVDRRAYLGWLADYVLGTVAAARGNVDEVEDLAARMCSWALPRRAFVFIRLAEHLRALVAGGQGDVGSVYIHATAVSPVAELDPYVTMSATVAFDVVRSATRTGRDDEARAHVAAMDEMQLWRISSRTAMIHLACRALVSSSDPRRLFEQALAVPGAEQWVFEYARIQCTYGMELRRGQELVAARRHLEAARSTFESLGATSWAARAQAELDATAPTRNVSVDEPALTAYERRIASMVTSGLSNKEVAERLDISHRTVGNHLYRIYAKLGVASRVELRDALAASR